MYSTRMASDISPADRQQCVEKRKNHSIQSILPLGILNDAKKRSTTKRKTRVNVKTVI